MKNILFLLFLVLFGLSQISGPALAAGPGDPFDARILVTSEKRFLQAALARTGHYTGMIDGKWGHGSQSALEDWAPRHVVPSAITFGHIRPLVAAFRERLTREGWRALDHDKAGFSYLVPRARLNYAQENDHPTLATPGRGLVIRGIVETRAKTAAMHRWITGEHVGASAPYRHSSRTKQVTAGRLKSGKTVYLISFPLEYTTLSVLVQFEPRERGAAQLVISSFRRGAQRGLDLPPGGRLARLAIAPAPRAVVPVPAPRAVVPAPLPKPSVRGVRGSGTGFFVNNTDLVTAAHVIDGCSRLTLEDGTRLTRIAEDPLRDLAVLASDRRVRDYLGLAGNADARLGARIFAVGYPYRGILGSGLSLTAGNVASLPQTSDPARRLTITAPVQPGNSGGPLLDRFGDVIGVVVSRLDDIKVLRDTGSLPQNLNFAVSAQPLRAFLNRSGVFFARGTQRPIAIETQGLPDRVARSVVAILCH